MAQQYEDLRVVRERALGQGDFRSGIVVIEIASGEVLGPREMRFACLTCWREARAGTVIGFT